MSASLSSPGSSPEQEPVLTEDHERAVSPSSASIIICTERGELESMAKLLVSSLRKFGGTLADIPVYSYAPRKGRGIDRTTREFFDRYAVVSIEEELNHFSPDIPVSNKIFAMAHAEEHLSSETLIFLDTDVFVCNEPSEFVEFGGADCVLRPVHFKILGASDERDPNFRYWEEIYRILGGDVRESDYVHSTVDDRRIFAYWNSGHIVARRRTALFRNWKANFVKVHQDIQTDAAGRLYLDQATLAATVTMLGLSVKHFSNSYNYPLPFLIHARGHERHLSRLDEITTAHYHTMFRTVSVQHPLRPIVSDDEKSVWFMQAIRELDLLPRMRERLLRAISRAVLPARVRKRVRKFFGVRDRHGRLRA